MDGFSGWLRACVLLVQPQLLLNHNVHTTLHKFNPIAVPLRRVTF